MRTVRIFALLLFFGLLSAAVFGQDSQDCCGTALRKAKEKFSAGDYKGALDKYELAKKCPNASNCSAEIAAYITFCRKKLFPSVHRSNYYTEHVNGVSFEMVSVEGGTFQMGSSSGENNERPVHGVSLSSFSICKTEVTQALWQAVIGANPSYYKGDTRPVEQVSWEDCQLFVEKLNRLTGKRYRLPTEAEWEYASRGGNKSRGYLYSGSDILNEVAWYVGNSGNETHAVGQKQANELGLYDMSGNVWEWCKDWYGKGYYGQSPTSNPQGVSSGSNHIFRGGSWNFNAQDCRSANRFSNTSRFRSIHLGFRLVSQ